MSTRHHTTLVSSEMNLVDYGCLDLPISSGVAHGRVPLLTFGLKQATRRIQLEPHCQPNQCAPKLLPDVALLHIKGHKLPPFQAPVVQAADAPHLLPKHGQASHQQRIGCQSAHPGNPKKMEATHNSCECMQGPPRTPLCNATFQYLTCKVEIP